MHHQHWFPVVDRPGRAEGGVSRRRQHAAGGRARHRQERRARRRGAAARREVLLGRGPRAAASNRGSSGSTRCCSTRSWVATATRRSGSRSWRAGSRPTSWRVRSRGARGDRGAAREGRPHDRHGARVHRAPGHDGRHLRARRGRARGGLEGDLLPLPADRCRGRRGATPARSSARRRRRGPRCRSPTSSIRSSGCSNAGEKADRVARSVRPAAPDARHRADTDGSAGAGRRRPRAAGAAVARGGGSGLRRRRHGGGGGLAGVSPRSACATRSSSATARSTYVRGATQRLGRPRAAAGAAHRRGAAEDARRPRTSGSWRCSSSGSRTSPGELEGRGAALDRSALTEAAEVALLDGDRARHGPECAPRSRRPTTAQAFDRDRRAASRRSIGSSTKCSSWPRMPGCARRG